MVKDTEIKDGQNRRQQTRRDNAKRESAEDVTDIVTPLVTGDITELSRPSSDQKASENIRYKTPIKEEVLGGNRASPDPENPTPTLPPYTNPNSLMIQEAKEIEKRLLDVAIPVFQPIQAVKDGIRLKGDLEYAKKALVKMIAAAYAGSKWAKDQLGAIEKNPKWIAQDPKSKAWCLDEAFKTDGIGWDEFNAKNKRDGGKKSGMVGGKKLKPDMKLYLKVRDLIQSDRVEEITAEMIEGIPEMYRKEIREVVSG